jgi:hypothetical protein
MRMPEWGQNLTPTDSVGRGFILRSTPPAQWVVSQPHQVEVSAQGIMPSKESGNNPGLYLIKGLKPNLGAPTGSRHGRGTAWYV